LENTQLRGKILYIAEVVYENITVYTMRVDVINGGVGEGHRSGQTVDCETSMVRVFQNVTHASEINGACVLSLQSTVLSLFPKLLSIFNSRGEATTMPARARVMKGRNETIVSGATQR
jgi:hypothetical protein